jgi:hypothetical protein
VGIISLTTTAVRIGRNVKKNGNFVTSFGGLDNNQRAQGRRAERAAIQKTSTTTFERDAIEPIPRGNQAATPVKG